MAIDPAVQGTIDAGVAAATGVANTGWVLASAALVLFMTPAWPSSTAACHGPRVSSTC